MICSVAVPNLMAGDDFYNFLNSNHTLPLGDGTTCADTNHRDILQVGGNNV